MVHITVQQLSSGSEPPSWCIIELQGTIERLVQPEAGGSLDLGTLYIPPQVTNDEFLLFGWSHLQKNDGQHTHAVCMRFVTRHTENTLSRCRVWTSST